MSMRSVGFAIAAASLLSGCGSFDWFTKASEPVDTATIMRNANPYGTDGRYSDPRNYNPLIEGDPNGPGSQGLMSMLLGPKKDEGGGGSGIGVNSFLWRATLDTVSFMPLASADPFGGVIISDWYSPAETPNERFKVNVFILGRELRADGVRCSVFRQRKDPNGAWIDAAVDGGTGTDIENAILTRARQIRIATAQTK